MANAHTSVSAIGAGISEAWEEMCQRWSIPSYSERAVHLKQIHRKHRTKQYID